MLTRREMLFTGAALAGAAAMNMKKAIAGDDAITDHSHHDHDHHDAPPAATSPHDPPAAAGNAVRSPGVHTPNGATAGWKLVNGVKVFHLVAGEFEHEFAPGLRAKCWGYNGRTPGPTIEAFEGDRVRVYVTNRLPAPTSVHWHGVLLPNGMDGVSGVTQPRIEPGETCRYEFTLKQHGTFMYHSHYDDMTQNALGLVGMFVVHPRLPAAQAGDRPKEQGGRQPDRDFALMLGEWRVTPGTSRPDPNEMTDFNILTLNGKAFPATAPIVVRKGDLVRIRIGNLSPMSHHSIHIHGHHWTVVGTDGGEIAPSARWPETTVLVPVGSTRTLEFIADAEGDWPMHCHMSHHTMNQMGHGNANVVGVDLSGVEDTIRELLPEFMAMGDAGMGGMGEMGMQGPENSIAMLGGEGPMGYIDMGGMFTIIKVRDGEVGYDDPGWYKHPAGTVALAAAAEQLAADGIDATSDPATLDRPANKDAPPARSASLVKHDASADQHHRSHQHGDAPAKVNASQPATAPSTQPAIYVCPMHKEITSPEPARCPKCGMKLVQKK